MTPGKLPSSQIGANESKKPVLPSAKISLVIPFQIVGTPCKSEKGLCSVKHALCVFVESTAQFILSDLKYVIVPVQAKT